MNEQIEQAIRSLRATEGKYARTERYYSGEHDLAFASEKFENAFGTMFREFAMNLCPAVCDSLRDKLTVKNFGVSNPGPRLSAEKISAFARMIWDQNQMPLRSAEIHNEAAKNGDAYAIVWPDETGRPVIYPNRAAACTICYDDEIPARTLWAAKHWKLDDKRTRLNILYPDRIEKFVSAKPTERALPDAAEFVPYGAAGGPVISNPYGIVPVFHFANNTGIGTFGRSELDPAIPIQDGLNKCVLDMLVAMEFSAFRQRWVTGIEVEHDTDGNVKPPFKAGIDRLWVTSRDDARFGEFGSADLEQFLKVKDSFRVDIASVTGTPLHYLLPYSDDFPSGEALRKAETRFIAKVRARQSSFGHVWSQAMAFAMRIAGAGAGVALVTEWEDPAPYSERETLENIRLKKELGISTARALLEAGYADADIREMTERPQY